MCDAPVTGARTHARTHTRSEAKPSILHCSWISCSFIHRSYAPLAWRSDVVPAVLLASLHVYFTKLQSLLHRMAWRTFLKNDFSLESRFSNIHSWISWIAKLSDKLPEADLHRVWKSMLTVIFHYRTTTRAICLTDGKASSWRKASVHVHAASRKWDMKALKQLSRTTNITLIIEDESSIHLLALMFQWAGEEA